MSKPLFKVTNKAADTLEIDIEGEIGGISIDWATWEVKAGATKEAVKKLIKDVANSKASNIIVNINSYGGDVNHGISIHDMLAEHKAKVTTIVHGHTASAATIIAQAGDVRKMSDNALYLVHPASIIAFGNAIDLKTALSDLEKVDGSIAGIYAKRTGKTIEEVIAIMNRFEGRGEWLSASEAKDLGFVDEIFEPMKAVASADPAILARLGLPGIPQDKIKHEIENMKAEKSIVKAWFDEFIAGIKGKKSEAIADPNPEETTDPVEEPKPDPVTEPEATVKEVVIKDMAEVQAVLDDFTTQALAQEQKILDMQAKITVLETDLARAKGLPTVTEPKDDPLLDPGKPTTNEAAAEKNATQLKES